MFVLCYMCCFVFLECLSLSIMALSLTLGLYTLDQCSGANLHIYMYICVVHVHYCTILSFPVEMSTMSISVDQFQMTQVHTCSYIQCMYIHIFVYYSSTILHTHVHHVQYVYMYLHVVIGTCVRIYSSLHSYQESAHSSLPLSPHRVWTRCCCVSPHNQGRVAQYWIGIHTRDN